MRVLIVEDEVRLAETLRDLLQGERLLADVCHDGESGLDNALSGIYDLVILDVMLPRKNGLDVLAALRKSGSSLPVLLLTAKSELADRVAGLDRGADYYLTKPFEPKELLACVRALLRRQGEFVPARVLEFGDLRLDGDAVSLSCAERSVHLSRKEYEIMELLMRSGRAVVTKETLIVKVWGYESDAEDNNAEVYISFLRKKLEHLRSTVKIRTVRSLGYRLEAEE